MKDILSSDLMLQALDLALYGMGSVFVFLTLLVACTMLMSALVGAEPEPDVPQESGSTPIQPAMLAAVAAAVRQYRTKHPGTNR